MVKQDEEAPSGSENLFEVRPAKRIGPIAWLRSRFFTGIVVAAPIGITIWLVWSFVTFVDSHIKPLIPDRWNPETYTQFALPGLGLLVAVLGLTIIGTVAANLIGKYLLHFGERIIGRVPLVRNIHMAVKQIFETLAASQSTNFQEVVMVQYPRQGSWAVGFVTATAKGEMAEKLPGLVGVFVPTTPNPTSGFLIYLDRGQLIPLSMSVEEGAKLIISAGLVVPEPNPEEPLSFLRLGGKKNNPDKQSSAQDSEPAGKETDTAGE